MDTYDRQAVLIYKTIYIHMISIHTFLLHRPIKRPTDSYKKGRICAETAMGVYLPITPTDTHLHNLFDAAITLREMNAETFSHYTVKSIFTCAPRLDRQTCV